MTLLEYLTEQPQPEGVSPQQFAAELAEAIDIAVWNLERARHQGQIKDVGCPMAADGWPASWS